MNWVSVEDEVDDAWNNKQMAMKRCWAEAYRYTILEYISETIDEDYDFDGYHWTEVLEALGIYSHISCDEDSDILPEYTQKLLRGCFNIKYENNELFSKIVKLCRRYVEAMENCDDNNSSLWKGLLDMKYDGEFLKAFSYLIPMAWT